MFLFRTSRKYALWERFSARVPIRMMPAAAAKAGALYGLVLQKRRVGSSRIAEKYADAAFDMGCEREGPFICITYSWYDS